MSRGHRDKARRKRHVLADHSLDRQISLYRLWILKVLGDMKREREDRPKPGEFARVELHQAVLIHRCRGNRLRYRRTTDRRIRTADAADRSVHYLKGV